MYNDLFTIGPVTIHTYGVMTAIGIIAAYFTAEYRARKHGLDSSRIFGLVIYCLIFGYLGSKILYYITVFPEIINDPSLILRSLTDGWVVYGGIIGGLFGAALYCKKRKLPLWSYFDIGLTSVALAQGFGRIGCFMAGCCYGMEMNCPISVTFTHSHFAPNNVPLFPTQLLSSGLDFLLFAFLVLFMRGKNKKSGQATGLYLICYGVGRFILEFFRGDIARGSVGILSTSQFISIFISIAGIIILALRTRNASGWDKVPYRAAIFDLDGTILYTFDSIANAVNLALVKHGYKEIDVEKYKTFIGDGLKNTVARALKYSGTEDESVTDAVFADAAVFFAKDPYYKVEPYDGIIEAVEAIKKEGCLTAVLTNKAHDSAVKVVERFFGKDAFDVISGEGNGRPLKPDPECAKRILKELKVNPAESVYFGDSSTDMKTGKSARFYTVGVTWGSRPGKELTDNKADYIIDSADMIPDIVNKNLP